MTKSDLTQQQTVSRLIDSINWAGVLAEVMLAAAVFGFLGYFFSRLEGLGQFDLTPRTPAQASWHPNTSVYCISLHNLNLNQSGTFIKELAVDQIADAAPTPAPHSAAVALYNDVADLRPTDTDFHSLAATYSCSVE